MREDWDDKSLFELSELITKGTTPTSVGFRFIDNGINFIKVQSITTSGAFIPSKFAFISDEANHNLKRSQLKDGDILFSIAGELGRTAIVTKDILPANTNQAISIIRIRKDAQIDREYLRYALTTESSIGQIRKFKGGVAQQNLSLNQMKNFHVPIPPLPEQKHIVAILDQAFDAIDRAKANIEKNTQNARELFQSKLDEVFLLQLEKYQCKKMIDYIDVRDGTHDSPKYIETGYPLITSKNLKNGELNFDNVKYISKEDFLKINKRSKVEVGDILFAMIGTIGNPIIINQEPNFAIKNVALFKSNSNYVSKYLSYYLQTSMVINNMISDAKGTTQKFVSLGYLRNFPLYFQALKNN